MTNKLQFFRGITSAALLCVLISACSKENINNNFDRPDIKKPEKIFSQLKFHIDRSEINIFDPIKISLLRNGDSAFMLNSFPFGALAYMSEFDSVILEIPNVLKQVSTPNHFTFSQSQVFMLPGQYPIYLAAYKDNKIRAADTATIKVHNLKDFLNINWKTSKKSTTGSRFEFLDQNDLYLSYSNDYAYLTYHLHNWDAMTTAELYKKSRTILFEYMIALYGKPYKQYDGVDIKATDLTKEFLSLFTFRRANAYPVAIWKTPSTYIALVSYANDVTVYEPGISNAIIAEPIDKK